MNLIDIGKELGTEQECFAFLERQRWPDGVRCATCGCNRISRIERKSKSKNVRKNLYQCLEPTCKQQFSVTSGTIFHDSRIGKNILSEPTLFIPQRNWKSWTLQATRDI